MTAADHEMHVIRLMSAAHTWIGFADGVSRTAGMTAPETVDAHYPGGWAKFVSDGGDTEQAGRAAFNRAHVRRVLPEREPEFFAALEMAYANLSGQAHDVRWAGGRLYVDGDGPVRVRGEQL